MRKRIPFNYYKISVWQKLEIIFQLFFLRRFSGDGKWGRKVEEYLENTYQPSKVLLTNSCSGALDICSRLIAHKGKDEIIVSAFTFPTSVSLFSDKGYVIKFCEIDSSNFSLDPERVKELISDRTCAIVVTNYGGINPQIGVIKQISNQAGIFLIEDNAQGIFSKNDGKLLGTFGDLGVISFHETKNISCGEGGAVIINNQDLLEKAIRIRDKGTNRREFENHIVNKYQWVENCSNYYLSEFSSLILYFQLVSAKKRLRKRKRIWLRYFDFLTKLEHRGLFSLPKLKDFDDSNYHLFYLKFELGFDQKLFIKFMEDRNITTPFHYQNLATSPMANTLSINNLYLNITDDLSDRIVRLPLFDDLKFFEQRKVLNIIKGFVDLYRR